MHIFHTRYADLPRGPIKNNSMKRLAATTLLDILPPDIADRVGITLMADDHDDVIFR